jgi:hypothetical protein
MKMIGFVLCALSAATQLQGGVTPVQKVITMMQEMKAKAAAEKEAEIKIYEEYEDWCKNTATDKKHEIITSTDAIGRSEAAIEKHTAAEAKLTDEIAAVNADIAQWQGDHKAATEVRETEKADYDKTHADYAESIDALGRAIVALKKAMTSPAQAMMMIQTMVTTRRIPGSVKPLIAALMQAEDLDEVEQPTNPPVAGYEAQSGGVVEMLEKLLEEFRGEISKLEKEEMETKHAYDLLAHSLSDQIKVGEKEAAKKEKKLGEHKVANGESKAALAQASADKKADEEYLADLKTQCTLKGEAFETRQQMRAEELEALDKAIAIIKEKVSGNADKHLPGLIQKKVSLMMLRSRTSSQNYKITRAAQILTDRAAKLGSQRLSLLAVKVENSAFDKVIGMIKDLITKLQEEAAAEGEHKAWCDGELKENKLTRDAKTEEVDSLTSTVEKLKATLKRLSDAIAANAAAMAELDAAMLEATETRQKEKAKNEETIADAKEALLAVGQAMKILKEFYAKAAGGEEFLQGPAEDAPASFENEAYTGQQGASTGVLGMMEVIHSDFARLEADTSADESTAAKEFETFMDESAKDKEQKRLDNLDMSRETTAKERDLEATQTDLSQTHEELDAALAYYEKLKPDCIEEQVSFEERAQMRQEEIDSLNEVYTILSGEAEAF